MARPRTCAIEQAPVQRRILYAMHELGMRPNTRYRKTAGVVGEVLKNFHPHGEIAIYDSLVRMAQDFTLRYPRFIDGQATSAAWTRQLRALRKRSSR